jgi:hypothetical protein
VPGASSSQQLSGFTRPCSCRDVTATQGSGHEEPRVETGDERAVSRSRWPAGSLNRPTSPGDSYADHQEHHRDPAGPEPVVHKGSVLCRSVCASFADDPRVRARVHRLPRLQVNVDLSLRLIGARSAGHGYVKGRLAHLPHTTFSRFQKVREVAHQNRVRDSYPHGRKNAWCGYRHISLLPADQDEVTRPRRPRQSARALPPAGREVTRTLRAGGPRWHGRYCRELRDVDLGEGLAAARKCDGKSANLVDGHHGSSAIRIGA